MKRLQSDIEPVSVLTEPIKQTLRIVPILRVLKGIQLRSLRGSLNRIQPCV